MTDKKQRTIFICEGTGCVSGKSNEIRQALEKEVAELGLQDVKVDFTGCHGFCEQGPIAIIEPEGIFYTHLTIDDVRDIVEDHLINGKPVERLFYREPATGKQIPLYKDINFYRKQQRIILRNCHYTLDRVTRNVRSSW